LILTFSYADISVGAHLGGLVGGVVCSLGIVAGDKGMLGPNRLAAELALMLLVGAVSFLGAIALA
jgi:hypothetical protein